MLFQHGKIWVWFALFLGMFHTSVFTFVAVNFGVWTQNTFDAIAPYSSKPDSFTDHHPQQHSHQFKLSNLPRVFYQLFLPELFYGHVVLCPLLMVPVHVLHQSSKDCTFFIAYIALYFFCEFEHFDHYLQFYHLLPPTTIINSSTITNNVWQNVQSV